MATLMEHWTHAGPISSPLPLEELEHEEARTALTVGAAAPLGLVALATALFTWSTVTANWWPAAALLATIPIVFIFGGIVQFIAAMWSYRKGDTFNATWFGAFGGFFTAWSLFELLMQDGTLHGAAATTMVNGVVIGCFAYIALFLAIAALRVNVASFLVLILLAASLGLMTAGLFYGGGIVMLIGGWCGIVSALVAFYAAAALVINSTNTASVLPLGYTNHHVRSNHRQVVVHEPVR